MLHRILMLSSLGALLLLSACGDDSASSDTAPAEPDMMMEPDPQPEPMPDPEPEPLQASTLFGACVEDSQCPGEGAICRTAAETGNPGGTCTVPCEDRTPCDFNNVYHHCLAREGETQRYCERRCLNGLDCGRSDYTCQLFPDDSGQGVCFGVCVTDEDCGDGAQCEPYSGQCTGGEPSTQGAITGEACGGPEDCRSAFCIGEDNGWPGGSCAGTCILPSGFNSTTFFAGQTLPPGDCAGDALCLPLLGTFSRGDSGACLSSCASDDECRGGYTCRKSFEGSGGVSNFLNGVCWPAG